MTYLRTVGFKREFSRLPADVKERALNKFDLFTMDWKHPSLNIHKVEGASWHGRQVFELYVTQKYRVLFIVDEDVVVSFSIGPHSIVSQ